MDAVLLDRAACRGHDLSMWFPGPLDLDDAVQARLICARCPVMAECVVAARFPGGLTGAVDGIRGGLSLAERQEHVVPAVALERAQLRAGWRPCLECGHLFKPSRRNHRICTRPCWNRRGNRTRYQNNATARAERLEQMRRYRKEAAAVERVKRHRRYWADPEAQRAKRRERYRRNPEPEKAAQRERYRKKKDLTTRGDTP